MPFGGRRSAGATTVGITTSDQTGQYIVLPSMPGAWHLPARPGVENVRAGIIGATSQQYPLKMAQMGVEAITKFAADGTKPENTEGKDFVDTGVTLITDAPAEGVESEDTAFGLENCWG